MVASAQEHRLKRLHLYGASMYEGPTLSVGTHNKDCIEAGSMLGPTCLWKHFLLGGNTTSSLP